MLIHPSARRVLCVYAPHLLSFPVYLYVSTRYGEGHELLSAPHLEVIVYTLQTTNSICQIIGFLIMQIPPDLILGAAAGIASSALYAIAVVIYKSQHEEIRPIKEDYQEKK